MTTRITMLSPISGGITLGLMTAAGSPYTVAAELAAELVNRGVALYIDPQVPGSVYGQFVTYLTNAQFGQLLVGTAGVVYEITDVAGRPQYRWNGSAFVAIGATTAGLATLNPTDITVSRAIAAADFGTGILRINSAAVVAITLPTVAAMALAATAGQVRMLAVEVLGGGIPTFAGATASTTINGTAGPTTVLPLGGAPVTNGIYVLTQQAVGSDAWSLS